MRGILGNKNKIIMTLFDEGKKRYTNFELPDAELKLWEQFFEKDKSDYYYKILLKESPWKQRTRKMYDRMIPDPRLTVWYGSKAPDTWSSTLLEIKERVEHESEIIFNSVLLNYYRDGNDSVAWLSDTLPSSGKHYAIASVTFGETRLFKVRHKTSKEFCQLNIPLTHGSFLLMGVTMQYHYEHHVPKTSRNIGERINLTFRISGKQS
jgi:alkylated DNA repair dioxygenase AlkB